MCGLYFMLHRLKEYYICSLFYAIVYIYAVVQGNSSKARVGLGRSQSWSWSLLCDQKKVLHFVYWLAPQIITVGFNFDIADHNRK